MVHTYDPSFPKFTGAKFKVPPLAATTSLLNNDALDAIVPSPLRQATPPVKLPMFDVASFTQTRESPPTGEFKLHWNELVTPWRTKSWLGETA